MVPLKIGMGNESGGYDGVTQPPLEPANSSCHTTLRRMAEEALQLFLKKRRSPDDCFGLVKKYKPKQYQMGLMYRTRVAECRMAWCCVLWLG